MIKLVNIKKLIREELELSNIVEKALSPKDRKKAKDDGLVHFGGGIWGKKKDKVKGKKKKGAKATHRNMDGKLVKIDSKTGKPKEPASVTKGNEKIKNSVIKAHDKKKGGSSSPKYGKPLALAHYDKLKKSMKFGKTDVKIINETSELEEEYNNEVTSLTKDTSND